MIAHPGVIHIRNYLPRRSLCYVSVGYKVCLQPAFVQHGPVKILPYLYANSLTKPCEIESGRPQKTPHLLPPSPADPLHSSYKTLALQPTLCNLVLAPGGKPCYAA